jgi:hypothetical protein
MSDYLTQEEIEGLFVYNPRTGQMEPPGYWEERPDLDDPINWLFGGHSPHAYSADHGRHFVIDLAKLRLWQDHNLDPEHLGLLEGRQWLLFWWGPYDPKVGDKIHVRRLTDAEALEWFVSRERLADLPEGFAALACSAELTAAPGADVYVPASSLVKFSKRFPSYPAVKKMLDSHPEIRTRRPSKNRLHVHRADWDAAVAKDAAAKKKLLSRKELETLADAAAAERNAKQQPGRQSGA